MAASLAKAGIDRCLVSIQQVIRHKRLDGAGKAAALQAPGTAAVQHFLAQGQRQGHALLLVVLDAVGVLVELKARVPALDDQLQEGIHVVRTHGIAQSSCTAAVVVEVDRAHNGTVAHSLAQLRDGGIKRILVHFTQDLFAHLFGHALHLAADGGIVVGQVGVAALGVGDAHGQLVLGQVDGRLAHDGMCRVLEVDRDNAADGAGGLIHQAAGLVKEHVLGVLADLRDLDLGEFLHVVIVVLAAQDGPDADLERRRAGQAGTAQHVAGGVGVEAADLAALVDDACRHAADQRCGVLFLMLLRDKVGHIDVVDLLKAEGLDADDVLLVGGNDGHDVQVDRACQHHAVVMVGVVAADLGAAGGRVQAHGALGTEFFLKLVKERNIPLTLGGGVHVGAVKLGKSGVVIALPDLLFQFHGVRHNCTRLSAARPFLPVCTKRAYVFWANGQSTTPPAGFLVLV